MMRRNFIAVVAFGMIACGADPASREPHKPSTPAPAPPTTKQACRLEIPPEKPERADPAPVSPTMRSGLTAFSASRWKDAADALIAVAAGDTQDTAARRQEAQFLWAVAITQAGGRAEGQGALSLIYRTKEHLRRHDAAVALCEEFDGKLAGPEPTASAGAGAVDSTALLRACARVTRGYFESRNLRPGPQELLEPTSACVSQLKGIDPAVLSQFVSCVTANGQQCQDVLQRAGVSLDFTAAEKGARAAAAATPEGMKAALAAAEARCESSLAECEKACPNDDAYTCIAAGGHYWDGRGVPTNFPKGTVLFRKACAAGNAFGCKMLEDLETKASACGDEVACTAACDRDLYKGCVRLGESLVDFRKGTSKDATRALGLFKKACDGYDGSGCRAEAFMRFRAIGVPKNVVAAQTLMKTACDTNTPRACEELVGFDCVVQSKAAKQRRPADDRKCVVAQASGRMPAARRDRHYSAFQAPDENRTDICHDFIRAEGCFQLNVTAENRTVYCCE